MEIKFKPENIKVINTDEVRPNTWNPKDKDTEEFKKIKKGIELKGQRLPIIVRENNGYEIIDGEQRWTACKELGFDKVVIYNEGMLPDKEAKQLTIWYQTQVAFNEVELAGLLKDLSQYPNLELPYTTEEIANYAKLSDFSWEDYNKNDKDSPMEEMRILNIPMSLSQYEIIMNAINKVKEENTDASEARALELIAADFLSGVENG